MSGNFNWVGSFNECRNVSVPVLKNTTQGGFNGQYCQLSINLLPDSYNFPLKLGTCLPNTCDSSNLITILNTIMHKRRAMRAKRQLENYLVPKKFQSFFPESFVSTSKTVELKCFPESREFSYGTIVYISVVLVVAACCLIGATITLCSRQPIKEKDCCDLKEMSVPKTNNIEMSSLPNIENNGDSINGTSEDSSISGSNSEGECVVTNEVRRVEDGPQVEEEKQDSATSSNNSEGECSATNKDRCAEDVPQVQENKQDSAISDSNSEGECNVTNEVRCVENVSQVEEEKKGVKNFLKKFFLCFCPITNEEKMQLTAQSQRPVLNGLRSFAAAWVLLCHTFSFAFNVVGNPVEALSMADNLWYQVILNGFYSVDIFFLLRSSNKGGTHRAMLNLSQICASTSVRIYDFLFVTSFRHLASGPFWPHDTGTCQDNWWMNLLFCEQLVYRGSSGGFLRHGRSNSCSCPPLHLWTLSVRKGHLPHRGLFLQLVASPAVLSLRSMVPVQV
ncbi:nose resistant to fluoxetine protein 6 [Caerostris extrusa]|uniref:Nose resistant to fluoxetine protein 6 n=1 Tax=Caerostris extrusa TaxID=172846 RepID=A0AAV4MD39_CAEEX|nr:nose resistant to fluoxetine protein 6 [Caerostris extrusa]